MNMIPELIDRWSQGWLLTATSSLLCVLGCSVIYFDDIYYLLVPKFITSRYGFHLQENYTFLNGSLAFSSGCLLFTSLYKLLPAAMKYLRDSVTESDKSLDTEKWLNFDLIASYIFGIVVCLSFNAILHLLTSESVVHCNHGGHDESDSSAEEHELDTTDKLKNGRIEYGSTGPSSDEEHSHSHSHSHSDQHHAQDHSHSHSHVPKLPRDTIQVSAHEGGASHENDEHAPLLLKDLSRKKSILHYIVSAEEDAVGECKGYSSAELCLYQGNARNPGSPKLHFCEIPELSAHPDLDLSFGESPHRNLAPTATHESEHDAHSRHTHHRHDTHEDHSSHVQDHHHHINSPISRLLLIGIQTTLAITLHKFPEGFITFITSETNPELGVTIFLSLLFHNFTEGFSMCLPLYYSFASGSSKKYAKLKALGISAFLGGLAQPLGALLGLLFLRMNHAAPGQGGDSIDLNKLNFVFGITMAITSGFLSVVGLSMYGSAVSFGGSLNFVLLWCVAGMSVIGLSSIISAH